MRPFSRSLYKYDLKKLTGHAYTLFKLTDHMCSIFPGDPVEIVDRDDLSVWIVGEILAVKRVRIRDITDNDIRSAFPCPEMRDSYNPGELSRQLVVKYIGDYYDVDVSEDNIVSVVYIRVSNVTYPEWRDNVSDELIGCPDLIDGEVDTATLA